MSYSLGFSPEFFFAEGEPYDRSDPALNDKGDPVSVWSAIHHFAENDPTEFDAMAREVFGVNPETTGLAMEDILDKIRETNTCSNLSVPVRVWIDEAGDYYVEVWE